MLRRIKIMVIPVVVLLGLSGAAPALADFVCPVLPISEQAVNHSRAGFIAISGGDYSILPGKAGDPAESPVSVPDHATNGNGAGAPDGPHSVPGDPDYSAIWNTD